jgi:hypothetical protein
VPVYVCVLADNTLLPLVAQKVVWPCAKLIS